MEFQTIVLEKLDHIAKVTLNRPERLNAINRQMFEELNVALQDVADDSDVRVVVLTGAGRAFCASADIKEESHGTDRLLGDQTPYQTWEFISATTTASDGKRPSNRRRIRLGSGLTERIACLEIRNGPQRITLQLHQMEKPTIAMVNGLAIGDGFDWVLACDIRMGCENTRFMNAFVQMGLVPNTGGAWLYPRSMGANKALELLYTGDWLQADEAHRLGVLNRLVPVSQLEEETMTLARRIADRPPIPNRLIKGMVHRGQTQSLEEHLGEAAQLEILTLTSRDHQEALRAFLEKSQPHFEGH